MKKLFNYLKSLFIRIKIRFFGLISYILVSLYAKFKNFFGSLSEENETINKILVCRYDFYGKNKELKSSDYFYIDQYFEQKNINFSTFYWDNPARRFPDIMFFKQVLKDRPEVIIMMGYNPRPMNFPGLKTLKLVRNTLGVKILSIWGDTGSKSFIKDNIKCFKHDIFYKHICIDNPILDLDLEAIGDYERKKFLPKMYTPESEDIYFPIICKDIDVAFMGQISSYRDYRKEYVDYAQFELSSFKTYFSGINRVNQMDHNMYASMLNRAKIGLNFSMSVDLDQLKGRAIHTMLSGAMLLETKNLQTASLFNEGEDYVSFSTKEEMVDKIKFYLKNNNLREAIARRGREKVLLEYSREKFWHKVLQDHPTEITKNEQ